MHCHRHCQCHNNIASYGPAPPLLFNISRSAPEYLVLLLVNNIRDSLYQETTGKEASREGGKEGGREGGREGKREEGSREGGNEGRRRVGGEREGGRERGVRRGTG